MKRRLDSGLDVSRLLVLAMSIVAASSASGTETAILVSPTASINAELAYGADVSGTDVVIGAPGETSTAGAVYTFDCATLPCGAPARFAPVDLAANDAFGTAVSISGDTFAASAPGPEPGAVYVYVRSGSNWTQQARLTASGGSTGEHFGAAIALSGDRLAVGADDANNHAGVVYVFVRTGTAWVQEARITAADPVARDALGASVALDGDTLVAGAPLKRNGSVSHYANGVAYVFVRNGSSWSQQAKLVPASVEDGALFGFSVDIAGDRAIVGSPYAALAQGTAYVFARSGTAWSQQSQLNAPAAAAGDQFGWSVALGDDKILIGAPFAGQLAEAACGASYLFDAGASMPSPGSAIEQPLPNQLAGWSVAMSGSRWVSSAPGYEIGDVEHAGAAYWFDATVTIFRSGFDVLATCTGAKRSG